MKKDLVKELYEYIENNCNSVSQFVNQQYHVRQDEMKQIFISLIQKILTPVPKKYIWTPENDTPYDYSGTVIETNEFIDVNQKLQDFLNEYCNLKEPTYTSGYGWHHMSYADLLHYDILDISGTVLADSVRQYLESEFNMKFSNAIFDEFTFVSDYYSVIYENCLAFEFYYPKNFICFLEIENFTLKDVLNYGDKGV